MIRSFYYLPGKDVKVIDGIADFDRLLEAEGAVLWVDLCKPTDDESYILTHDFKFHPLAIEDVISEKPQTKIDDYNRYLFMVFQVADYVGRDEGLKISELDLFLGKNMLVTVHYEEHRIFDFLYGRAEKDERLMSRGPDFLFHAVIDTVVDNYNATLDIFEYEVDQVEDDILGESDEDTLKSIFTLRRDLIELKRIVGPQKEALHQLERGLYSLISDQLVPYFSDIHDHLVRLNDIADAHRESLISSLELYYSSVSTETNKVIKVLTILTAIFIPPTFKTSLQMFFGSFQNAINQPLAPGGNTRNPGQLSFLANPERKHPSRRVGALLVQLFLRLILQHCLHTLDPAAGSSGRQGTCPFRFNTQPLTEQGHQFIFGLEARLLGPTVGRFPIQNAAVIKFLDDINCDDRFDSYSLSL